MPTTSGVFGQPYPNSSAVPDVPGDLLLLAQSVDDDLATVANLPVATSASLPASGNWLGREISTTDSGLSWRWDGAAWRVNSVGLVPIIPTSVAGTGVTVNSAGVVSYSASATVNVNGCFTSAFQNYRIVLRTTFGAPAFWGMRLRVSGTDAATAYDWQRDTGRGTTAEAGSTSNDTAWNGLAILALANSRIELELDSPRLAVSTWGSALMSETNGSGSMGRVSWGGYHRTATAYDGISFIASTSSGTGSLRVYGYN